MPRRSRDEARAAILSAATEVFLRYGYAASTLENIGSEVGISRPAVLHHFRSKQEVLRALTDPFLEDLEAMVAGPVMARPPSAEQRREFLVEFFHLLVRHRDATRLMHRFTTETTVLDIGSRLGAAHEAILRHIGGTAVHDDPVAYAVSLCALGAMAETVGSRFPLPVEDPAVAEAIINAADRVLAA